MLGELSVQTQHFFSLTPAIILSSVEEFGLTCTGRVTQLNSMENRVYEVEIEPEDSSLPPNHRDRFRIVKFYRPGRWSKEQIQEEHTFLADLTEREVPVIAPLRDAAGDSLRTQQETGIHFTLFLKQGGRCPDELTGETAEWLGRLLARMHSVGVARSAPHRLQIKPNVYGLENLKFLVDAHKIPRELAPQLQQTVERICTLSDPLFSRVPFQRIHGDCHFGNILWGSQGPFLVDFDDMVQGPPVQDLWLILPGRGPHAKQLAELLLYGYEQIRTFDRASLQLIEPLRALRMIHYAAWIGRRWEDPSFQRAFPDYGSAGYWNVQLADLREQLMLIQEGIIFSEQE
jgi:Ser/Thr protein kinase RdoA (MazF antagonist)